MRRSFYSTAAIRACTLAAILLCASNAMTAEKPAPPKPKTGLMSLLPIGQSKPAPPPAAVCDKLKEIGEHLARALDVAVELLSGNEADILSKNHTTLLSGNSPTLLSGNTPKVLSGNKPTVLSGNQTPIFSGNTFSLLSNIKLEIHIENSGNSIAPPPQPPAKR